MQRMPRLLLQWYFDDVSDGDSIDDAKESEENYVEPRESDSECAEDTRSDDHCGTSM